MNALFLVSPSLRGWFAARELAPHIETFVERLVRDGSESFALQSDLLHHPSRCIVFQCASSHHLRNTYRIARIADYRGCGFCAVSKVPIVDANPIAQLASRMALAQIYQDHRTDTPAVVQQSHGERNLPPDRDASRMRSNPSLRLSVRVWVRYGGSRTRYPWLTG
jgi:hypothetical protein